MDIMNVNQFIKYTKDHPEKFIDYCEIIITRGGLIFFANPSHIEAMVSYICNKIHTSREKFIKSIPLLCSPMEWIIDKYELIAVWHFGYMYSSKGLSSRQKFTIRLLEENNLINKKEDQNNYESCEYKKYLWRKAHGYEE